MMKLYIFSILCLNSQLWWKYNMIETRRSSNSQMSVKQDYSQKFRIIPTPSPLDPCTLPPSWDIHHIHQSAFHWSQYSSNSHGKQAVKLIQNMLNLCFHLTWMSFRVVGASIMSDLENDLLDQCLLDGSSGAQMFPNTSFTISGKRSVSR